MSNAVLRLHQNRCWENIKIERFVRNMMKKTLLSALNEKNHSARSEDETSIRKTANGPQKRPEKGPEMDF